MVAWTKFGTPMQNDTAMFLSQYANLHCDQPNGMACNCREKFQERRDTSVYCHWRSFKSIDTIQQCCWYFGITDTKSRIVNRKIKFLAKYCNSQNEFVRYLLMLALESLLTYLPRSNAWRTLPNNVHYTTSNVRMLFCDMWWHYYVN